MLATRALPRACAFNSTQPISPFLRALPTTVLKTQLTTLHHFRLPTQRQPHKTHFRTFATSPPSMSALPSYLITPSELSAALKTSSPSTPPRLIPLCASWFLPNDPAKRTGHSAFLASRLPHARFFGLDDVCDLDSSYPHMLPTAETFAAAMTRLGIRRDDTVVVYDTAELGLFSAPRVAWTLRVFGHEKVHVLNSYKKWVAEGREVETGEPTEQSTQTGGAEAYVYPVPTFNADRIIAFREVKDIVRAHTADASKSSSEKSSEPTQIIDVRSAGRFSGSAPEPRPGLPSGHMPRAINIPLPEMLDAETGAMKGPEELRRLFESKGLDPAKPIVSTCGTGVMAAACDLALEVAGYGREDERRVYDGSWTEWAMRVKEGEGLIVEDK